MQKQENTGLATLHVANTVPTGHGYQCVPYVDFLTIRGLVINYGEGGGATKREGGGGHVKFYPYEKGGTGKVLAILRPSLSKKLFPVHQVKKKKRQSGGQDFFFACVCHSKGNFCLSFLPFNF